MAIVMKVVQQGPKGEVWTLDLGGDRVLVRRPDGEIVGDFDPAEAPGRIQFPSFSSSIRTLGIALAPGRVVRFDVPKSDLEQIRDFLNQATAFAGEEAVLAVRNRALRDIAIGAACTFGGVLLTIWGYLEARRRADAQGSGSYRVMTGLVLFGVIMLGKGIYQYAQYGKIRRMAD